MNMLSLGELEGIMLMLDLLSLGTLRYIMFEEGLKTPISLFRIFYGIRFSEYKYSTVVIRLDRGYLRGGSLVTVK